MGRDEIKEDSILTRMKLLSRQMLRKQVQSIFVFFCLLCCSIPGWTWWVEVGAMIPDWRCFNPQLPGLRPSLLIWEHADISHGEGGGVGWGSARIREWRFTFSLMLRNRFYNLQLYSAVVLLLQVKSSAFVSFGWRAQSVQVWMSAVSGWGPGFGT